MQVSMQGTTLLAVSRLEFLDVASRTVVQRRSGAEVLESAGCFI